MATAQIPADELALYDRQLRLWGVQAQQLIKKGHILIISMRALGVEIAKNLTLAGIGSLTIIDDGLVTEEDLGACYFLREEDIGKPRAESAIPRLLELNPRVDIKSGGSVAALQVAEPTFFEDFTLVVACDLDFGTLSRINAATRVAKRPFYAACIHGEFGFIFADLIDHGFVVERDSNVAVKSGTTESTTRTIVEVEQKTEPGRPQKQIVTKREIYCPLILANSSPFDASITSSKRKLKNVPALLPALRALFDFERDFGRHPDSSAGVDLATFTASVKLHAQQLLLPDETLTADFLRSFIAALDAELPTTASFIGSRLSEDVINAITHREQPIQNFALFDSEAGPIYCLYSPPPEALLAPSSTVTNGTSGGIQLPETGSIKFPNASGQDSITI
ncbi:hypothetical protein AMS68_004542 [Peltaster fructicola]|uniref:Ubiquitin-like 1-activating enzyme E1A n=1 Tax=Peltaster fructicola TaxID=286661 RepID=A0A6H0XWJ1_9PEZI|nr:hypothetical protein AMS68_004542 [Peltaster fructicola]